MPIVAHTWSVSSYNPVQALSTPGRFEGFVPAHSGGRGEGRREAIRLAQQHENVYMDFGGDIYCFPYFEELAATGLLAKVLYGTDYPWMDTRSHLTWVYKLE